MPRGDAGLDSLFLEFQLALAGRYSIDRELGRGGMGVVYLAREVHLDRLIAIKLLPPDRAEEPGVRERFLREARLAAKLSHPNIIPIHAVDEVGDFVFYVMAFVDGETLAHRVATRGPLSASEGTRVLREVAWALGHAHAQGLVHRDVKPDNILLEAGSGRALVADFGIAAAAGDTLGEGVAGTPEFMSPEQALGQRVDARSDLYSLGATAYFALSGRLVFDGASATEVLAKHVTEPAPTLASLGVAAPRRLAAMIERCLSKDPAHRPKDAAEFAEQMAAALEQRREVPAALRDFVKRTGRVDGAGTLVGATLLSFGSVAISSLFGPLAGFGTLALGGIIMPLSYLVATARMLATSGFTHRDLAPAFKAELELSSEERTTVHGRGPSVLERGLRSLASVGGAVSGITLAAMIALEFIPGGWILANQLAPVFGIGTALTLVSGISFVTLLQRRQDVDTLFWSRLWLGRAGRAIFGVAKRLAGASHLGAAMTHRATELSLGVAAEQLYERLPRETREALGDLPRILRRLQDDAQRLRKWHDEVEDALASRGEAAASSGYVELRALRDQAREKLSEAVGALETVRLNLLRLHAGSESLEGFTTHLGVAAEVAAQVERIIEARAEVDRVLLFPREIARTPA